MNCMEKGGKNASLLHRSTKMLLIFVYNACSFCVTCFQPAANGFRVVRGHWTFLREILIFERKKHTSNDYYIRYHDK